MSSHTVEYDQELNIIKINYSGDVSIQDVIEVRKNAIELHLQNKCYKSLTDFNESNVLFGTLDVIDLANTTAELYEEYGFKPAQIQRAIVFDQDNEDLNFLIVYSDNRGQMVELFHDYDSALSWLKSQD